MKLSVFVSALAATLVALTGSANADDASPWTNTSAATGISPQSAPASGQPRSERQWYGYQTLAADGAAVGIFALGSVADSAVAREALVATSLVSYAVTPAILHFAHGHTGKGVADLGLRVGTPLVGAAIGFVIASATYTAPPAAPPGPDTALTGPLVVAADAANETTTAALYGAAAGAVVAMAVDALAIARESVPQAAPRQAAASPMTVQPTLGPTKNGVTAGLSGTF